MTPSRTTDRRSPHKNWEEHIGELAAYATFRRVDAIDGRNVRARVRCYPGGGEAMGYGRTINEALQALGAWLVEAGLDPEPRRP